MLVVALVASPLLVTSAVGPAPEVALPPVPITEAEDSGAALAAARGQGEPVVVRSLMTPTRTVSAQPDGTMTAELSVRPVRTLKGGSWTRLDPSLARSPGGVVAPKAGGTPVEFSGGGVDAPLVKIGTAGASVALSWPNALPVPVLDGPSATYSEVFPGVDLVLKAEASGVVQHLVVQNADAAKNPALARIAFGLTTDGLTVRAAADGALEARNAADEVVFSTPPSTMWDASQERQAAVGVEVDSTSMTLVPDAALLADPAAEFPIVIDPAWNTSTPLGWTKVFSGKPNSGHWNGGNDVDTWAKVGECVAWPGCNGIGVARSYFQFDTGFLNGKQVMDATFTATIAYGPRCSTESHEIYRANGTVDGGTTWNNAPQGRLLGTSDAQANYDGCVGYKGIGFNLNVEGGLNQEGWSTYFLKAKYENDKYSWRKYDAAGTKIVVKYNTRPNDPYEMTTDPRLVTCRWCGGAPYVGDDFIRLQSKLSDADNDQLTAIWDVYGGPTVDHRVGPTIGSGNAFSTDVDLRGRDGQYVSWTVYADDGTTGGPWKNGPGPFTVDRVGIDRAPGVTGGLYQEDNRWHGGVDVPGTFTFDAAGVADVDHYLYGWNDPPSTSVDADALGGKAVVSITPPGDGPRDLYVQSVDRAGHRSPTKKTHLYVRAGNGPLAQWSFEGNAQDTAFLGDRHGTVTGGAGYTPGAVGSAVALDAMAGGQVTAPNALRTDASFSVSTWAKVDNGTAARAILSQDGVRFAGFALWYRPEDGGKWVFTAVDPDSTDKAASFVRSAATAQLGVWTHLAAVYDAPAKQVRLYVNGELSASKTLAVGAANTTGPFRVGRAQWNGGLVDFLGGAVDEVKLYDRILSDGEVRSAVSRDNVQVGYWKFDEESGTTAGNSAANGTMGVLHGGAEFVATGAVNGSLQLDEAADHVSTSGPVVRTDQSFSVAAWAKLDEAPTGGHAVTVLSQEGAVNSGYFLEYRDTPAGGTWEFLLPTADTTPYTGDSAVRSGLIAKTGVWTHLTGVYDAPAGQIRIYVDGQLAGTAPRTGGFNATGPMFVGRGKWLGTAGVNPWKGGVDEVRAYSRVVTEEEIRGIVGRDNVTAGNWKLDGNTQDSSPRGLHGSPINAPDYTGGQSSLPDPSDLALRLEGSPKWVDAPHAVDVDRSFSVAAWARLDQVGGTPTVVSQDGARISGFTVRARTDGRWGFAMYGSDAPDDSKRDEAVGGTVQIGQWTHLVAVHDASAKQMLLYVNGVLAGSVAHTQTWNAAGGLQIGRAKWDGGPAEYFKGSIDDVSAYSRALFATEIQTMAGRDLTLVHNYPLDESSGRNAADAVGARGATLNGGAAFTPGRVGNAVAFDGVDDTATTTGVDLRTDQAFTVSALVKLPTKACDLRANPAGCRVDAVTIDGARTSKFRLGHVVDRDNNLFGAWTFEMPESDADNAVVTKAAVSTLPSEVDTWVHLVGVYDPATKKIWLYVDGTRVGDGNLNTPWQPTGGLVIGRGKVGGAAKEFWPGSVDDVRLYTGQLDKDRISGLFHSYPAEAPAAAIPTADAGLWKFDENTGTTVADSSGRGRNATMKGGAGWTGGREGPGAWLDGTSGYAETAGPVVDTSRSFSVATWAYLTAAGPRNLGVLGQDGTRVSSFLVQYNGASNKWSVVAPKVDQDDPGADVAILDSAEPAAVGEWTHLAVSYDAELRQIRLYVNGLLSGAQVGVTVLPSTGPLSIGRAKWNGARTSFFPRGIDDVRVYAKVISDGEVRKIHEDVVDADFGFYRFDDGTAKDLTWHGFHATTAGGATYGPGITGKALHLNGTTGHATAPAGLSMRDSFTVSAWAKLTRDDQVATIVSQDGDRMSGFVLQYRPGPKRWVFGAAGSDSDGAPLALATAAVVPALGEWTHVTGVYDYAGRQLRVYVDGRLAGAKDNVVLWRATGGLVLGRDKTNGLPSGFFAGALDDVRIGEGIATDPKIADRGGWSAPQPDQLGRFANAAGDRYTGTTDQVREGYHFDATFGRPVAPGENTRMLYACKLGTDSFTAFDEACEGKEKVGEVGLVYTRQPTNLATTALYRCNNGPDHFESRDAACDGATNEGLLGYTLAYGTLARYNMEGYDHVSTTGGAPASYRSEGTQGVLALTPEPGTRPVYDCQDGYDRFSSTDSACEGKTALGTVGHIWTAAPVGVDSRPVERCRIGTESFLSLDACEGSTPDRRLGFVLVGPPALTAVFE